MNHHHRPQQFRPSSCVLLSSPSFSFRAPESFVPRGLAPRIGRVEKRRPLPATTARRRDQIDSPNAIPVALLVVLATAAMLTLLTLLLRWWWCCCCCCCCWRRLGTAWRRFYGDHYQHTECGSLLRSLPFKYANAGDGASCFGVPLILW
jgi:hypothetical protein